MSNRIEPTTHIDIRVVKNLLYSRINEGRDLMKTAALSNQWKKKEQATLDKLQQAMRLIEEAINIKESDNYETSKNTTPESSRNENR